MSDGVEWERVAKPQAKLGRVYHAKSAESRP